MANMRTPFQDCMYIIISLHLSSPLKDNAINIWFQTYVILMMCFNKKNKRKNYANYNGEWDCKNLKNYVISNASCDNTQYKSWVFEQMT